jgi:hypothetical protein
MGAIERQLQRRLDVRYELLLGTQDADAAVAGLGAEARNAKH